MGGVLGSCVTLASFTTASLRAAWVILLTRKLRNCAAHTQGQSGYKDPRHEPLVSICL